MLTRFTPTASLAARARGASASLLVAAAAVLGMSLAACGGVEEPTATPEPTPAPTPEPTATPVPAMPAAEKSTVVFGNPSWTSAQIQTYIATFIIEQGYQYPVELVDGDTTTISAGILADEIDVMMEFWLPNGQETWDAAINDGIFIDVGESLEDNWQGFVVPQYLKDANASLISVFDIPAHLYLFPTGEDESKAQLVNCILEWDCAAVNRAKVEAYGLEDAVELYHPDSSDEFEDLLEEWYAERRPFLSYMWGPTKQSSEMELYILDEPDYTVDCWDTTKACAYPLATVKILAHFSLEDRAPDVLDFLRRWDFSTPSLVDTETWILEKGASPREGSIYYLENYRGLWETFVPAEVATRVNAALELQ